VCAGLIVTVLVLRLLAGSSSTDNRPNEPLPSRGHCKMGDRLAASRKWGASPGMLILKRRFGPRLGVGPTNKLLGDSS
jgi:hypothetical protein